MVRQWPDKALPRLGIDAHTAVVTLTHDAKPDDMALGLALMHIDVLRAVRDDEWAGFLTRHIPGMVVAIYQ